MVHVKVIIEAVFDGRADGEFDIGIRINVFDGLREDMRSRVTQSPASVCILKRQKRYFCILRERRRQVNGFAVKFGSEDFLGQAVTDRFDEFLQCRFCLDLTDRAIV